METMMIVQGSEKEVKDEEDDLEDILLYGESKNKKREGISIV